MRAFIIVLAVLNGLLSSPVQAATPQFAPIPQLYFTKVFGGANPLPQVLSVTSVGTGFVFGTSIATASGGSWLSSPDAGYNFETPSSISVVVNPVITLAVGTYTGQVLLSGPAGVSLPVTVTLTIAAAGSTYFDNFPGGMSFAMKTGGTSITSQNIQVRNAGSGTLNWTLTDSTSDGGSWLTISSSSGTGPAQITVGVTVANLPGGGLTGGTFIGQLLFQNAGGNCTVPISVVVGANTFYQINPLAFTMLSGGANPLPQILKVASTGTAFAFSVSSANANGGAWLTSPDDDYDFDTPSAISVVVNASPTLAVGNYTGQIVFTATGNSVAIIVPVTLTVAAAGSTYLDNLPGGMSFSMPTSGTTITSQTLQIRNAGTGTLNWTLTGSTSDGGPWLTVSASSGAAPSLVTIGVSVANLPNSGLIAGTFIGQLLVQTAGSSVTVPVSVVVGSNVFSQINGINFTKVFGGANPLPQTLTVASIGANFAFSVSSSTATGGAWLSVADDDYDFNTPTAVTATVNASPTLAVGTYTGQIVFTATSNSMAITVPVTLTVAAAGSTYFDNLPGQISFSLMTGSSNKPPAQTIQIRDGGTGTLSWTLTENTSDGGDWLSASAESGTAPSLVSISVSPQNLPGQGLIAGTFLGEIVLQSAGNGSVTVPVSVVVGANVFNQVNAINFTMPFGGANPLPQTLTIASTGTNFAFSVSSSTATGGAWLSVADDDYDFNTPHTVTAVVTASPTLAAGTYTGQIVLIATNNSMAITVPVTLTVAAPGSAFFDNVQGQMSFSFQTATGNPPSQSVQIRNGGSGTLSWTAATNTSDGGNWLTVSAASGTAPSTVTVGILASALPGEGLIAGTFTGELVFLTSGSTATIPVSVVVGPNVFVQLSPLSFSKGFGGANPSSQPLTISSTGTNFAFSVTSASGTGGAWLSVADDDYDFNTPTAVTVAITAIATLAPGTYTGQVVLTTTSGTNAVTVPVYLTVANPFTINPTSASVPATGSSGTVTVTSTSATAPWTAVSNASFITVTAGSSGTGNGTVSYTVAANTSASQQIGTITIGGLTFTVTEAAGGQAPPEVTVFSPSQGATGVSTAASLTWGAVTGATSYNVYFGTSNPPPSVTTTTGTSYTPPAMNPDTTYYWSVTAVNSFGATSSVLWSFTTASPTACSFGLSPGSASLPATGTSTAEPCPNSSGQPSCGVSPEVPVTFTVTPSAACGAWTATSSNPEFLQITSGASGSGAGTVGFVLLNNTHNGRQSYTITVANAAASASYSVTEGGNGDSEVYREVYALYEQLLGRDPDPGGFAFWTGSGGAGLGQMADDFLTSPEAFNSDFLVMAAYQAATDAPPTYAQYNAAVTSMRAGTQTVPGLFTSLTGAGFSMTTLYQNLLNRAPTAADSSCTSMTLAGCFQTIIGYPSNTTPVGAANNEFQSTGIYNTTLAGDHTNALYVQMIYYVTLSRDPDPSGLAFWIGIANSGGPGVLFQGAAGYATRIQILGPGTPGQGFIGSTEFQGLFAN